MGRGRLIAPLSFDNDWGSLAFKDRLISLGYNSFVCGRSLIVGHCYASLVSGDRVFGRRVCGWSGLEGDFADGDRVSEYISRDHVVDGDGQLIAGQINFEPLRLQTSRQRQHDEISIRRRNQEFSRSAKCRLERIIGREPVRDRNRRDMRRFRELDRDELSQCQVRLRPRSRPSMDRHRTPSTRHRSRMMMR